MDDTTLSKNQILPMAQVNKHKETAPGAGEDSVSSKNGSLPSSNGDSLIHDDPNPIGIQI